jgi:replication factor A1
MSSIKDLQPRQGNVDLVADVLEVESARTFDKFGKAGRVANATISDVTGKMKLTLWNEQIDIVKVGDRIHIVNGYVSEFRGEMQLGTGKFGSLEVVGQAEKQPVAEKTLVDKPLLNVKKKDELVEAESIDEALEPKEDADSEDVGEEDSSDGLMKKKVEKKSKDDDLDDVYDEDIVEEEIDIEEEDVR